MQTKMPSIAAAPLFQANSAICLILFLNFLHFSTNSFCGESAIPFSLEILPNGHPVLGCARPNCFGWDAFGHPIRANESNFFRVNKQPDGFFRKALASTMPKPLSDKEAAWYGPQTASCLTGFKAGRCSAGGGHWVGGIAPNSAERITDDSRLLLRCCRWHGLSQSTDHGIATVRNGQIVYGGEVLHGERQYAFDYVSDIQPVKTTATQGLHYEVSIHRMACLPRPERLSVDVEPGVFQEMLHKFALSLQDEQMMEKKIGEDIPEKLKSPSGGQKPTKQRHNGESRVIKTSKWIASPVENEPEEEGQNDSREHANRAYAAPNAAIQGPFVENEIEQEGGGADYEEIGGGQQPQEDDSGQFVPSSQQNGNQNGHYGQQQENYQQNSQQQGGHSQLYAGPSGGTVKMVTRKRIICDRNMTARSRAVRQACEEVEIEAPEGTEVQVNEEGNYYDPGQYQQQQEAYWYRPSSWYYYYPSAGFNRCFSAGTKVRLANGATRRMDELRTGEWVYSTNQSQLVYTIVESWIHRMPDQWADFVRIELADGRVLKLTGEHFIYKRSNCLNMRTDEPVPVEKIHGEGAEMVFAREVRPGDCLFAQQENSNLALLFERPVVNVGIVHERGIFAPMTGTGDILVEGVLASCFAIEPSPVLQKSVFNSWKLPPYLDAMFGMNGNGDDGDDAKDLPGWLHFMVDFLMPAVLPK